MIFRTGFRIGLIVVLLGMMAAQASLADEAVSINSEPAPAARHPNIVFILTDDMALQDVPVMPKLQKLMIDEGTTFANFFVTNSQCCPSRSSILRGQYVHNHGVLSNSIGFKGFHDFGLEASTIGTWLKSAGYTTAYLGKYLNGYPKGSSQTHVPAGWDEWHAAIGSGGYKEFDYTLNENGRLVGYGHRPDDYLTDVITRKAKAIILQAVQDKKPFFLHLAPFAPHEPSTPAPRHRELFADAKAPRTASFNAKSLTGKPAYIRARPLLTEKQIDVMDRLYRKRIQSLQAVDDLLEELIETLKDTGQLQNTFVVFTSDNGYHLGQNRLLQGKQTPYEEDIHVPLVIRGPGIPAQHTVPHLAIETDLAPTFAEWASVLPPRFVDGRSLEPLLEKQVPPLEEWRHAVLVDHSPGPEPFMSKFESMLFTEKPSLTAYRALRTNHYLYVQYRSGERELYDLRNDPEELQNLVEQADPELIKRFSSWLREIGRCKGEGCRAAEDANGEEPVSVL